MRMVKNEKGFTIIELLAVIVIASVILSPLMYSLVNNVTTNALLHTRRSSLSLADGAIYGFDKLSYTDLENLQTNASDHHLAFDSQTCSQLSSSDDEDTCDVIFGLNFNNVSFDETQFKVIVYDYNIDPNDHDDLIADNSIPQAVRDEIATIPTSTDANPGLLRITVWINYSDDPYRTIVVSGLLAGDFTDSVAPQ